MNIIEKDNRFEKVLMASGEIEEVEIGKFSRIFDFMLLQSGQLWFDEDDSSSGIFVGIVERGPLEFIVECLGDNRCTAYSHEDFLSLFFKNDDTFEFDIWLSKNEKRIQKFEEKNEGPSKKKQKK